MSQTGAMPPDRRHDTQVLTTVGGALAAASARLEAAGVPTAASDARWLVHHVTGWSPAELAMHPAAMLDADAATELDGLVARREAREPLQLILGTVGFRRLEIEVRPGVFIPRPETEVLVGEAIARTPPDGVVVEPCTGTGAVACAIAQETRAARVSATDVSAAAVDLARTNAAHAGVAVEVHLGDLLAPVAPELRGRVDVLVANPPYVAEPELGACEPEVREWDPHDALVAGPTGHEASDRLIALAPRWLRPGGWLLLEVAEARAGETAHRCAAAGLSDATVIPDLTGRDRIAAARRP